MLSTALPAAASAAGQDREPLGEFTGVSTGGFVGFDRESRQKAKENGTTVFTASETDGPFVLHGVLFEDGTWEAPDPTIPPLDTGVTEVEAELPDGLAGTFDLEAVLMTASGRAIVIGRDGTELGFEVTVTTGESGELTDDFAIDGETLTVTIVDNEYIVDDSTGYEAIDEDLGLPATEPGENYIEVGFELEPADDLVEALLASDGDENSDGTDGDGTETDGDGTETDGSDDDGAGFCLLATYGGREGAGYLYDRKTATDESE